MKNQFTVRQREALLQAIERAELNTSGEIRLHVESKCATDPIKRAIEVFEKLGMHKTELRNGVLIYLAMDDHKLAILGDQGINEFVPDHFWDDERDLMASHFKKGQFTEGLVKGIEMVGNQLKEAFPHQSNDTNELSDEISFGGDKE